MTIGELWDKIIGEASIQEAWFGDGAHKLLNLNIADLSIGQFIFTLAYIGLNLMVYLHHYAERQAILNWTIKKEKVNITFEEIKFWLKNIGQLLVMILVFYLLLLLGDSFRK